MDGQPTQVQVKSTSKTKMAIAVGFLGLAALAAGFAGLRTRNAQANLVFAKNTDSANSLTQQNEFSFTLKNSGNIAVDAPFDLRITLGDGINIVSSIDVLNQTPRKTGPTYTKMDSKDGSFDIPVNNYRLLPNQTVTISYKFVLPSDYNSKELPVVYTWDTKNDVPESDEMNIIKQKFDIAQRGFIKDISSVSNSASSTNTTSTLSATLLPDLAVTNITLVPQVNGSIQYVISYVNQGTASANGPFYIGIIPQKSDYTELSIGNGTITSDGYVQEIVNGYLAIKFDKPDFSTLPNGTGIITGIIPKSLIDSGMTKFSTKIDMGENVEESNEINNKYSVDLPTSAYNTVGASVSDSSPLPDLIIENFTITRTNYSGMKHFNVVIKNIGNATAVRPTTMHQNFGTFVIQMYTVDENGVATALSNYLDSQIYFSSLNLGAGKELTISKDLQVPASFDGAKKIKMKVDWLEGSATAIAPFTYPDKGYILESNENNNELTKDLQS